MRILHIGPISPHTHRVIRMIDQYSNVNQEWCLVGQDPIHKPDIRIIHYAQEILLAEGLPYPATPTVAWIWNELFLDTDREPIVLDCLNRCDLIVGPHDALGIERYDESKYAGHYPLVDGDTFKPIDNEDEDIKFFFARLGQQDHANNYWSREVREAMSGIPYAVASGHMVPSQMAEHLSRSKVVIATREDSGPSYTVVEACLCGKIPLVSDTEKIRQHFWEDGKWCGAVGVEKDPAKIRAGLVKILTMKNVEAQVARNLKYFEGWTVQAQGRELTRRLLSVSQ